MRSYRIIMVLAVICALAAALGSVRVISAAIGQQRVIAAAADLSSESVVAPSELEWVNVPRGALYSDSVVSPAQAVGYVVRGFVPAGTALRQSMLEPPLAAGIAGQLAQLSRQGTEYYALALPETAFTTVGGEVATGDRVDIWLSTGTAPLVADVLVLAGVPVQNNNSAATTQNSALVVAVDASQEAALLPYLTTTSNSSLILALRPAQGGQ